MMYTTNDDRIIEATIRGNIQPHERLSETQVLSRATMRLQNARGSQDLMVKLGRIRIRLFGQTNQQLVRHCESIVDALEGPVCSEKHYSLRPLAHILLLQSAAESFLRVEESYLAMIIEDALRLHSRDPQVREFCSLTRPYIVGYRDLDRYVQHQMSQEPLRLPSSD